MCLEGVQRCTLWQKNKEHGYFLWPFDLSLTFHKDKAIYILHTTVTKTEYLNTASYILVHRDSA